MRAKAINILQSREYKEADKEWNVELSNSTLYWYELLESNFQEFDTPSLIKQDLKRQKEEVAALFDKRFIYFICSRKKVRFNIKRKPRKLFFSKKVRIYLLIGKAEKRSHIDVEFRDSKTREIKIPKIDLYDKFITIYQESGDKESLPIHNFLELIGLDIGFPSKVEYVGYTKNPDTRPTNRSHSGLSQVLYNAKNDDNDILLYFNTFRVYCTARSRSINITVPNTQSKDVSATDEGYLIEKSFIFYFDSKNQNRNREKESGELTNLLSKIKNRNRIKSVEFYYEFERNTEYWELYSSARSAKRAHRFSVKLSNDKWELCDS